MLAQKLAQPVAVGRVVAARQLDRVYLAFGKSLDHVARVTEQHAAGTVPVSKLLLMNRSTSEDGPEYSGGIGPINRLLLMYTNAMTGEEKMLDGIVPFKEASERSMVSNCCMLPKASGIVPNRKLLPSTKNLRFTRLLSSLGISVRKRFVLILKSVKAVSCPIPVPIEPLIKLVSIRRVLRLVKL